MIWTNTSLFNSLLPPDEVTLDKNKATSIILGAPPIDINEFPNVKFIFRAGVGTDNVNFSSDIEVKFPSTDTKELIYEETANFTCNLIFKMSYDNIFTISTWNSNERNIFSNKTIYLIYSGFFFFAF